MKENKPPLFVKLFLPQNDKINQKQLISNWGQPHPKQFHVIDNPSIINRIATEISQNRRQYNSVKTVTQPSEFSRIQRPLYVLKKGKKSNQRIRFSKLNQEVNCLSDFIDNQVTEIGLSQIFQYKQKMLTTFLQSFFEDLERQCHEKANFIKQIWNQTMGLFDKIFEKQSESSLNYEKNSLNQILALHKSYQQIFQKIKREKQQIIKECGKLKQIIKSLARNIRERQKQIKVYKGGIDDYNNKLNDISAQFTELKKEHIDILMYGYEGSMTRRQAQDMLAKILKPDHQDEEDLRQFLSIKYIPPKLIKGKSEKFIKFSDDFIPETPDMLQNSDQIKDFSLQISPVHVQLRHNFVPKKAKFRQYHLVVDAKLQTDSDDFIKMKVNQSSDCSYFSKMEELIIKNKYCQTQNKRIIKINGFCQTDTTGVEAFIAPKRAKLQITGNLFDATMSNSQKKSRGEFLSEKFNTTLKFLKTQYDLGGNLQQQEQSDLQEHEFSKSKKEPTQKQISEMKKHEKKMQKKKNGANNSNNLTPIKQNHKQSKASLTKSIKMRIKTKPQENNEPSITKSLLKTQNFIKLNKMRTSNQLKKKIADSLFFNHKNIIADVSVQQINIWLIRCYFKINDQADSQIDNVRQSINSSLKQEVNHLIFSGQNWSNKFFKTLHKITNQPSQNELDLAFYFNAKSGKNKSITVENKDYLDQLACFTSSLDSNGVPKKNDSLTLHSQFQTFSLKKAHKIIEQIFQLCYAIREHKDFLNINLIEILERMFSPSTITTLNNSRVQNTNRKNYSVKTIEFLKFLIRNINENHLFKNFIFLCGINYKIGEFKQKQTGIVNINRTIQLGQKPATRKTIHIEAAIRNQQMQNMKKDADKQHYGTLAYSSEIIFYLDMFKAMNCYSNSANDIINSYTTLDMLQTQFEKIPQYYKDDKLIRKIKDVIEDSLRPSTLTNSKLNIFKCLQIFLEKVRQRKIQMMQSYSRLYDSVKEKFDTHINNYLMVQILTLVRAPPETQLKIMTRMFKKYEQSGSFEDLITFFVIQGFPDVQLLQQGLAKSAKQTQFGKISSSKKLKSFVLEYLNSGNAQKKNAKSVRFLNELNSSLKVQDILQKQIYQLMGQELQGIQVAHIFLANKE